MRVERHSPEPPPAPSAAVSRRRQFGRSARQRSFDEGEPPSLDLSSGDSFERRSRASAERFSSVESEVKYRCDKTGSSVELPADAETPTREPCADPGDKALYDKQNSFRTMRMRGTSSDRILAKKLKHDQKSVSSLAERITNSSGSTSSSIFEKHLGKFCKLNKLEKSKRCSASALYDQSPTEAFYNKTGSARLSSQELFEKFCSEDFTSLYGHENDNGKYYATYHSKSMGSSGSDVHKPYQEGLEPQPRKGALWCHGNQYTDPGKYYYSPRKISTSHSNLGAVKRVPQIGIRSSGQNRTIAHLDYSTDSDVYCASPNKRHRGKFSFDVPFSLPPGIDDIEDYDSDEFIESVTLKDHSLSAPLLSPNKIETRFTFDISEKSEVTSNPEDTLSDATETRNLTLYEDPQSDRTSLSDLYDSCFSTTISSKRSSFKREASYRRKMQGFDLTNLDFRPIDDESPNTSKYMSINSPDDTIRFSSETRSYCSDSVFNTPEKKSQKEDSSKLKATLKINLVSSNALSERSESTTIEEEPASIVDRIPEIYVEQFQQISLDGKNTDSSDRTLTPHKDNAYESKSITPLPPDTPEHKMITINVNEQVVSMCSRPSMHKLEPIDISMLKRTDSDSSPEIEVVKSEKEKFSQINEKYPKVLEPPELKTKREKSMFFKIKRVRDASSVTVHRQTRCFPL